jgi:putative transposase
VFVHQRQYKYRLYPTRRQREALGAQLRFACDLYNAALEQRRDAWRRGRRSIGYNAQSAELTTLRRRAPELLPVGGMNCWCQQEVLRRVDRAFQAFFRRVARGETPGYPRFKTRSRFSTLVWTPAGNAGGVKITERGRLRLQGIGEVKVKWHRPFPDGATVSEVSVTRKGSGSQQRFYVGFILRLPDSARRRRAGEAVGIDVGVRTLATLSSGNRVAGLSAGERNRPEVRRAARRVARRQLGSTRRRKAVAALSRAREREANRRRDAAHKLSRALVDRYALIAREDLKVQSMVGSACGSMERPGRRVAAKRALNRRIADQAWSMFFRMLAYKAEEADGRVVKVPAAGTSRTCSSCGHEDARSRKNQVFRCVSCPHVDDADVNAAKVILARALDAERDLRPGRGRQAKTAASAAVV